MFIIKSCKWIIHNYKWLFLTTHYIYAAKSCRQSCHIAITPAETFNIPFCPIRLL